ncbi:MAG: SWF/SNF helicase family protein [Saprospiraceae bacterium]|nr:SWF/SNF helicase family protein [Saprospiraceae bacterium]
MKRIRYVCLTGDNSRDERSVQCNNSARTRTVQVFLISLKAGGVGLNLTAANYVLILDPWWNPFAEKQAIARTPYGPGTKSHRHPLCTPQIPLEERSLACKKNKLSLATELSLNTSYRILDEEMMEYLLRD